jgi:hypothetical protein
LQQSRAKRLRDIPLHVISGGRVRRALQSRVFSISRYITFFTGQTKEVQRRLCEGMFSEVVLQFEKTSEKPKQEEKEEREKVQRR